MEARGFFILSVLIKGSPAKIAPKSHASAPFAFEFDFPGAPSSVFEGGAFAFVCRLALRNDGALAPFSLNPHSFDDPFGLRLCEIVRDNRGRVNRCTNQRSHHNFAVDQDRYGLPYVVPGRCLHFLSPGRLELHAYDVLRRALLPNDPRLRDIAIIHDDLIMKINGSLGTRYFRLTQTGAWMVFGQSHLKMNGRLYIANERRPNAKDQKQREDRRHSDRRENGNPRFRSTFNPRMQTGSRRQHGLTTQVALLRRPYRFILKRVCVLQKFPNGFHCSLPYKPSVHEPD
ncbi:MAG TPA: hypothetical protein VMD77_14085, partial [Candidatus Baltobacteraceae bacterium]|nr:hypothetical protein [Candidatus Baltobacteraceae bacterium]